MDFCYTFEKTVKNYIQGYQMISSGEHILVGVSGGADSLCLLEILHRFSKKEKWKITAVHVHHGIRGNEADQDEQFVKEFCKKREIPCIVYHYNVPLEAERAKEGEEEAGRRLRYESFCKTKLALKADKIALAHHKDDQAETILFHLIRGSSLQGLCGMQPVSGDKIRPFLCVERAEICHYLKEREISYQTDISNFSEKYARNQLRLKVVPVLNEINANAVCHMSNVAARLSEAEAYLKEQTITAAARLGLCNAEGTIWQEKSLYIEKAKYEQEAYFIRKRILYEAVCRLAGSRKDIEECHILSIDGLFSKQLGKRVELPYGLLARRDSSGIWLEKRKEASLLINRIDSSPFSERECIEKQKQQRNNIEELFSKQERECIQENRKYHLERFPLSGEKKLPEQMGRIAWKLFFLEKNRIIPKNNYTKWFDYDKISTALFRTRRAGDWFILDSSGRHKKLKQYFIDEKVPKEQREHIPLFADGSHIIWIVGGRISEEYKVREATQVVLELRFFPFASIADENSSISQ